MTTTTCVRHPGAETRLACSSCGDPICPRCAVPTPVGQKCPDCARQARTARARGKPRQYVKGVAAGVATAAASAVGLFFVFGYGFLTLIASGVVGYAVARAVRAGAEGNGAPPFRAIAIVLALVVVEATWIAHGRVFPRDPIQFITYLASGYGAWLPFR